MSKYDLESLLDDVKARMVAAFNPYVTAINTEKDDDTVLAEINSEAYFLEAPVTETVNYDPFIVYGIVNPTVESAGAVGAFSYELFVVLVIADPGNDKEIFRRLLRYQRAMTDFFSAEWENLAFGGAIRMKFSGVNPFPPNFVGMPNAIAVGVTLSLKMV